MLIAAIVSCFALSLVAPWLHRLAREWTGWLLSILPFSLAIYFARRAPQAGSGEPLRISYGWAPELGIHFSFYLDGLAVLFALIITGIGALIIIYAGGYLKGHHQLGRLYAFLLLFMGSMLGVVLSDNLITLFVFWELTSFSSYLLIGFSHERETARAAALQALLVTGMGGLALLAGLLLLGQIAGAWELSELAAQSDVIQAHALYLPALLLVLVGAFTKSAQVPFHFWLPDAMEAPAPVSAYLHAATMVKAGVYLLARLNPALGGTIAWQYCVTGVGLVTMVWGAYLASRQTQLKRVLAYSTVSGLGMLVFLLGIGTEQAVAAAIVMLVTHALYKGTLFLVAGVVDHEAGESDITRLGGLRRAMPFTALAAVLAAGSMAGLPPVVGFIAKEMVLESTWAAPQFPWLLTAAVAATAVWLVTVALMVGFRPFFGSARAGAHDVHEGSVSLLLGPGVLALLGLFVGLAPAAAEQWLLSSAAGAVLGQAASLHLALWHGFTPAVFVGIAAVLGGVALYGFLSGRFRTAAAAAPGSSPGYALSLQALNRLARSQTRLLQNGYLRYYLMIVVSISALGAAFTLWSRASLPALGTWPVIRFHEAVLAVVMLAAALVAAVTRSHLAAFAAIGLVGYGVGLIFLLFGAPDLAMTQFVVETLTVILFVLGFYRLPRFDPISTGATRLRDAVVAVGSGALVTTLVLVGLSAQFHPSISEYFAVNSVPEGHGRNIVNVILVDFRALDTLGEITVLAVAGIGVYALIRLRASEGER
jgi:multicomponent Na+:H+ antiporter subunit A